MSSNGKHIVYSLQKLRDSIKRKHRMLTSDIIEEEHLTEKRLKPVSEPIKELISKIGGDSIEKNKKSRNSNDDDAALKTEMIKSKKLVGNRKSLLSNEYISKAITNTTPSLYDHTYGIHYDGESEEWMLGPKVVSFEGNRINFAKDRIQVIGTRGLFELLFKAKPEGYTVRDLERYGDLLKLTGAHLNMSGYVKTSSSYKYKHIISVLFPPKNKKKKVKEKTYPEIDEDQAGASIKSVLGSGMMVHDTQPYTKYVYWDSANELVDRLRILIASKQAGHNAHDAEIFSIIEELRECGAIVGGDYLL